MLPKTETKQVSAPTQQMEVDVFLARGFLGGSDFERYHLQGDLLWRECGAVDSAGKHKVAKSDDEGLARDPNLNIEERRVDTLTAEQRNTLQAAASRFVSQVQSSKVALPKPGSVFGLTSPGLAELKLEIGQQKTHVLTEVDALSNHTDGSAAAGYNFVATLRGIGPVICRAKSFFGIKRIE